MDKNTLSNYGWVVIVTLILAVMLAFATPFGTYVGKGISGIAQGFVGSSNKATDINNIDNLSNEWADILGDANTAGLEYKLNPTGKIPTGATYTLANGTVLKAGDKFPETSQYLDIFRYGDYTYVYSAEALSDYMYGSRNLKTYLRNANYDGWLVTIHQETSDGSNNGFMLKKSTYGAILESINSKPVTHMTNTFARAPLTVAPKIPKTITNMSCAFIYSKLTVAPDLSNCTQLTNMDRTFYCCGSLSAMPTIPSNVTNLYSTFAGCDSLVTIAQIPEGVTNMESTFMNCFTLTTAPAIPGSVTTLKDAFSGCSKLTGSIIINANPTTWTKALYNTQITAVVGDTTMANNIMLTKTSTATNPTA